MSEQSNLQVALWDARVLADKIEEALQESGGEITEEIEGLLAFKDFKARDLMVSVDQIAISVDRLAKAVEFYNEQVHYLEKIRDSVELAKQRLADNLKLQMESLGLVEIAGEFKKVSLRLNPPKVEIIEAEKIDPRFIEMKVVEVIKKKEISEALKNGENLTFARLIQEKSLRITQAKKQIKGGGDE